MFTVFVLGMFIPNFKMLLQAWTHKKKKQFVKKKVKEVIESKESLLSLHIHLVQMSSSLCNVQIYCLPILYEVVTVSGSSLATV